MVHNVFLNSTFSSLHFWGFGLPGLSATVVSILTLAKPETTRFGFSQCLISQGNRPTSTQKKIDFANFVLERDICVIKLDFLTIFLVYLFLLNFLDLLLCTRLYFVSSCLLMHSFISHPFYVSLNGPLACLFNSGNFASRDIIKKFGGWPGWFEKPVEKKNTGWMDGCLAGL